MATCSDDGTIQIAHAKVFDDLMRQPLIVPVKTLRVHDIQKKLGVLNIVFHPKQPWIFSSGADGKVYLFQNMN